jgi:hypothetical protein
VRGVGDEALLRAEGGLEAGEEVVDGVRQVLQLVLGSGEGEALVEVALGDLPGRRGHRAERAQDATGDEPAESDRDRGHDRQGDPGIDEELVQGSIMGAFEAGVTRFDAAEGLRSEIRVPAVRDDQVDPGRTAEEEVGDRKERRSREEEEPAVEEGQAQADGGGGQPRQGQIR